MKPVPPSVAAFLQCQHIAVAGVSRSGQDPANAIFRRLQQSGHLVIPVNPNTTELEGCKCYPSVDALPGAVEALMVVTRPEQATSVARSAIARGIKHIWFHRSFGTGSVSPEALELCRAAGVEPIEGGCPLMYCPPVDPGHKVFRWWLGLRRRVPG